MDRKALTERRATLQHITIEDKVEATFGPNPCLSLVLVHEDGTRLEMPCNGKRCVHCGPRKKMTIQLQLQQGLGTNAYISRSNDYEDIQRSLATVKKSCQRNGLELRYQIVGDATLGWIVASNVHIIGSKRPTNLSAWMGRILERYHASVNRIRRSRVLGRLSLVRIRKKSTNSGQRSEWSFKTNNDPLQTGINAVQQAEIDRRDDLADDVGWHVWEEGSKLLNTIQAWK